MSHVPFHADLDRNPFLGQVLVGSGHEADPIRFPVTFAVDRESERIWALRLVPLGPAQVVPALGLAEADRVLVLSGGGLEAIRARSRWKGLPVAPSGAASRLQPPVEWIHLPAGVRPHGETPPSLLANPEASLPATWGSRVALSVQDACHGVILTPDVHLVRSALRAFLQCYQVSLIGRDANLPPIPDRLLDPLLEPLAAAAYHEAVFLPGERFWSLEFRVREAGAARAPLDTFRWVSEGEGGTWRAGWSW
ncbi:MAG: hypothetical protein JXB39_05530 [Deltaproteobacteria bacterium]|nr:hypothetical protein [Deltaproteobacteria bacterium]